MTHLYCSKRMLTRFEKMLVKRLSSYAHAPAQRIQVTQERPFQDKFVPDPGFPAVLSSFKQDSRAEDGVVERQKRE